MERNSDRSALLLLLALALLVLSFAAGYGRGRKGANQGLKTRTDTIVVVKHDTSLVAYPEYIYRRVIDSVLVPVTDTVVRNDTTYIQLPMERKVYEDSTYRAVISGYRPSLDTLQLFRSTRYVTITNSVRAPRRKLGLSIVTGPTILITPFTPSRLDAGWGITGGVSYTF